MQLLDHYYIILISAFSSQFGQLITVFLNVLWNFVIWEIRSYHSCNMAKRSECERLLAKIRGSYWFCTNYRAYVGKDQTPTGFVFGTISRQSREKPMLGNGFYVAYIDVVDKDGAIGARTDTGETQTYAARLYGWWSVRALLTEDVVNTSPATHGDYNILCNIGYKTLTKK